MEQKTPQMNALLTTEYTPKIDASFTNRIDEQINSKNTKINTNSHPHGTLEINPQQPSLQVNNTN